MTHRQLFLRYKVVMSPSFGGSDGRAATPSTTSENMIRSKTARALKQHHRQLRAQFFAAAAAPQQPDVRHVVRPPAASMPSLWRGQQTTSPDTSGHSSSTTLTGSANTFNQRSTDASAAGLRVKPPHASCDNVVGIPFPPDRPPFGRQHIGTTYWRLYFCAYF